MASAKDILFVGIQFILFSLFVILPPYPLSLYEGVSTFGLMIAFFGGIICCLSIYQLNSNLSPFPSPKDGGKLVTSGLYGIIRHPIYLGIILLLGGYALNQSDLYKLIVVAVLYILFHFKSSYEERLLETKFSDYRSYKKKTGKIFPRATGIK